MSCVPKTDDMRRLLAVAFAWPDVDIDKLRANPEWDRARTRGWILEWGELTGTGMIQARELRGELVAELPDGLVS